MSESLNAQRANEAARCLLGRVTVAVLPPVEAGALEDHLIENHGVDPDQAADFLTQTLDNRFNP